METDRRVFSAFFSWPGQPQPRRATNTTDMAELVSEAAGLKSQQMLADYLVSGGPWDVFMGIVFFDSQQICEVNFIIPDS